MDNWVNNFEVLNNNYNLPPFMSDGRNYCNLLPSSCLNEQIKKDANIKSNWSYRYYLQNNALDIMKLNTTSAIQSSGNNPFSLDNNKVSSNFPYLFSSSFDNNYSNIDSFNNNSDLKKEYINNYNFKARMVAPSIPTIPTNY